MGNSLKQYREKQYEHLKCLEERYWELYQEKKANLDELETHKIQIDEDNFVTYHYGNTLTDAVNHQNFWNDIYDELFHLGNELDKNEELKEIRQKRH